MKLNKFPDIDPANIKVISDARTMNPQGGAQRSYALVHNDPDAPWLQPPLKNPDGTNARWTPDYSITDEYKDAEAQAMFQATSDEQANDLFRSTWDNLVSLEIEGTDANARQGTANRIDRIINDAYDKIEEMYPTQWKRARAVNPSDPQIADRKKQLKEAIRKAGRQFEGKLKSEDKSAPSINTQEQRRKNRSNRSPL